MAHLKTTFFLKSGAKVVVRLKNYAYSSDEIQWEAASGASEIMKTIRPEEVVAITHSRRMF